LVPLTEPSMVPAGADGAPFPLPHLPRA
jgi:hypothetical protein